MTYAPTQREMATLDQFIAFTLFGVKPDTAKPPLKSLQVGGYSGCVIRAPRFGCMGLTILVR